MSPESNRAALGHFETRVTEGVSVVCCKGSIAYGIESAAFSGEIAELGFLNLPSCDRPQRRGND